MPATHETKRRWLQYCSYDDRQIFVRHGFILSMRSKGNRYDNSMMETVFETIKSDLISQIAFQSRRKAEIAIANSIDGIYNPVRRHSALGHKRPIEFEDEAKQETMPFRGSRASPVWSAQFF